LDVGEELLPEGIGDIIGGTNYVLGRISEVHGRNANTPETLL